MDKGSLIRYKSLSLLIIILSLSSPYLAQCSPNLPLDHWAYSDLERLAGFGLVGTGILGTKPFSRLEMARLVIEATERREEENGFIDHILERLKDEFRPEIETIEKGYTQYPFYKLVDAISFRYAYFKGIPPTFPYFPRDTIKGTSLWYNNDGVTYKEENNLIIDLSSRIELFNLLSLYYQPVLIKNNDEDIEIETHRAYLKFMLGRFELQVGKDSNWWGQGHHGNLILTNNTEPLKFIKFSNPTPILLPWIFKVLGPFKSTFLISKLEKERIVPHPLLLGLRINFKPHPLLELGASGMIMAGGGGRPRLRFEDILDIIRFEHPYHGAEDATNQMMAVDMRLRIPFLRYTEIYAEWGGEDTGMKLFVLGDMAYLLGVYVPRLTNDGKTRLIVEYADTKTKRKDTGRLTTIWYTHHTHRSGYTYKGLILGHHMGGDAYDLYIGLERELRKHLKVGLELDYEKRGYNTQKVEETHRQIGIYLSYDIVENLKIKGSYRYEDIKNFDFIKDNRQNNYLAGISFVTTF